MIKFLKQKNNLLLVKTWFVVLHNPKGKPAPSNSGQQQNNLQKTMKKTMFKVALRGAMAVAMLAATGCGDENEDGTTPGTDYGIEMVQVAGGTFTRLGGGGAVTLSSFSIGKYEVTQAQWVAVMGSNPSYFQGDNLPVEQVRWEDIQTFISALNTATGKNYRLPTEAEWEYAARGGKQTHGYTYSGSNTIGDVAWYGENSGYANHTVGTKQPNELGIYDMSGNVWEWCSDWWGNYSSDAQTNPTGPAQGSTRVIRGGGWSNDATYCAVSYRGNYTPGNRYSDIGFRLVVLP
jgi:formylglycine-generating enzyme required for sulfatase activity